MNQSHLEELKIVIQQSSRFSNDACDCDLEDFKIVIAASARDLADFKIVIEARVTRDDLRFADRDSKS